MRWKQRSDCCTCPAASVFCRHCLLVLLCKSLSVICSRHKTVSSAPFGFLCPSCSFVAARMLQLGFGRKQCGLAGHGSTAVQGSASVIGYSMLASMLACRHGRSAGQQAEHLHFHVGQQCSQVASKLLDVCMWVQCKTPHNCVCMLAYCARIRQFAALLVCLEAQLCAVVVQLSTHTDRQLGKNW